MERRDHGAEPEAARERPPLAPPGAPLPGASRGAPAAGAREGAARGAGLAAEVDRELGQLLIERGWLNEDRLRQANESQRLGGGTLTTCLLEASLLAEERLLEALSHVLGVPGASGTDLGKARSAVLGLLPAKVAQRTRAVPFRIVGGELWVAMEEVGDLASQDEIAAVSGRRLRPHAALEARVAEALETHYGIPCPERLRNLVARLNRPPGLRGREAPLARPTIPLTEEERASLAPLAAAREAPAEAPAPAAPPPPRAAHLDLEQVEQRLEHAAEREEIGDLVLSYLAQRFRHALLLRASPKGVSGWMGRGRGIDRGRLLRFAVDFEQPSVFLNLERGAGLHLGPLPAMAAHFELARVWGGGLPAEAVALPVRVRERLVAVLYADRGGESLAGLDLAEMRRLATACGRGFELFLIRKKLRKA